MSTSYTPQEFVGKCRAIIATLDYALRFGVNKAITLTNREAIANLSGSRSAEPWAYPVPVRTQRKRKRKSDYKEPLRAHQKTEMESPYAGYVMNDAAYARAIHTGYVSEWAGRGKHRMTQRLARPFIDDAVTKTQPLMVIQAEIEGVLEAWA